MPRAAAGAASSNGNATASRAIDVLSLFTEDRPVVTASEVAAALGMSRSTTYRYLQSLRAAGLLEDDETGRGLRLGPRVLQLAAIARVSWSLGAAALPVMRRLAASSGETVILTRSAGSHVVCIEEVRSAHPIRLSYERGSVLPFHAGASAKVLLAWLPPEQQEALVGGGPLKGFTASTVTSPAALQADLGRIRTDGYAVSRGEVDAGVLGVAAPIFRSSGEVAAGLSLVAPQYRVAEHQIERLTKLVREAAAELTRWTAEHEV